jgi:hypothetical protein
MNAVGRGSREDFQEAKVHSFPQPILNTYCVPAAFLNHKSTGYKQIRNVSDS